VVHVRVDFANVVKVAMRRLFLRHKLAIRVEHDVL
jgi:hypothetical protein